jgi:UDP-N-acetylglucosamine acyltransferase
MTNNFNIIDSSNLGNNLIIGNFNTIKGNVYIGNNVKIGNNCTIITNKKDEKIIIGDNCEIKNNVVIEGNVEILNNNKIFDSCIIGRSPQHNKFSDESIKNIYIGNNNTLREGVLVHSPVENLTKIGDSNYIMNHVVISHDVILHNNVVITAGVCLGGHCELFNNCNIGLNSEIHQHCRIGEYAMVGMGSSIRKDLPPFYLFYSESVLLTNNIGIERSFCFEEQGVTKLELFNSIKSFKKNEKIDNNIINTMFETFTSKSTRGFYR